MFTRVRLRRDPSVGHVPGASVSKEKAPSSPAVRLRVTPLPLRLTTRRRAPGTGDRAPFRKTSPESRTRNKQMSRAKAKAAARAAFRISPYDEIENHIQNRSKRLTTVTPYSDVEPDTMDLLFPCSDSFSTMPVVRRFLWEAVQVKNMDEFWRRVDSGILRLQVRRPRSLLFANRSWLFARPGT